MPHFLHKSMNNTKLCSVIAFVPTISVNKWRTASESNHSLIVLLSAGRLFAKECDAQYVRECQPDVAPVVCGGLWAAAAAAAFPATAGIKELAAAWDRDGDKRVCRVHTSKLS